MSTDQEEYEGKKAAAAAALREIDPRRPFGTELFDAVMRVSPQVAFEAVCLRRGHRRRIEVLLTQRAPDDTAYPSHWHAPGTFLRPYESFGDCVARLAKKEGVVITNHTFVDAWNNPGEVRGHSVHLIHWCHVDDDAMGQWFPWEDIRAGRVATPMVDFHRDLVIPRAIEAFKADRRILSVL